MISRCKFCNDVCPDGSNMCDLCCFLEEEDEMFVSGEEDDKEN